MVLGGTAGNFPFEEEGLGGSSPRQDMVKGCDYRVTPAHVDIVGFRYLSSGLTGNRRDRMGFAGLLAMTHGRRPVTRVEARGC